MEKIYIFGTCISRDVFRISEEDFDISYFPRSSFVSQFGGDKVELKTENNISGFGYNCVKNDFNKTFKNEICNMNGKIIIDLFDENLEVMQFENFYFTVSDYYNSLKEQIKLPFNFKRVENKFELFKPRFLEFYNMTLEKKLDVYLICFDFATEANSNETLYQFHGLTQKELQIYYDFIEKNCPEIKLIKPQKKNCIANSNHEWGLTSYHFIDEYYEEIFSLIFNK